MSALWTAQEIAAATGGTASGPFCASGVAFDSREVGEGDLFVAMKGEATDGHRFAAAALAAGAAAVLASDAVDGPHVRVADTARALEDLGRAARSRMAGKVIGVTGSVGKTGTKEALFQALDRCRPGAAHRSLKSYNNHVGVPLSLARMPRETAFGVFEMGMNHAGELAQLTRMVRPDIAIVTAIAPAHIEHLGSEEAIADAKAELFEGLRGAGTAIIPYDSPHIARLYNRAERHAARILTFGLGKGADVRAVETAPAAGGGTLVTAKLPDAELCFTVAAPGAHWVANALAVLAAVEAAGGDLAQAGLALAEMPGLPGRGQRTRIALAGGGSALLIDESYNANPLSMTATLAALGREDAGRRVAILGAMKELGAHGEALHAELAVPIAAAGVDYAILVGAEMAPLADALAGGPAFAHVADAAAAAALIADAARDGDVILVKGSNSVGLSRVVAALADPERCGGET